MRKLAAPSPGRPVRVVGGGAGRTASASAPAATLPLLKQKMRPSMFQQRGKLKASEIVSQPDGCKSDVLHHATHLDWLLDLRQNGLLGKIVPV